MAKLNDRIKERRLEVGLTLLEVAERLHVKEATAQRYESGEIKNIKHTTVAELANILMCSPEYLMGWTDHVNRPATISDDGNCESFLSMFKSLSEDNQKQAVKYLHFLKENEGKT